MQNKYEVIGIVGEGAYGVVYKCRNKELKEYMAIKKFKETEDEIVKKTMKRELRMLQILKHENIVEFKEAFKRKGNLFLVFEYVEKNLLELLQESPKGLDQNLIKKLVYQMCKATKYLHDQNIVHRDIKPENLLVDSSFKLKLCDFGFARTIKLNQKEMLTDYVATRWYRSPELLITNGVYGPEVDFWAIGCIMGELSDGDPLFPGKNEVDQINLIIQILGNLPPDQYESFYKNTHYQGSRLIEATKPETLERKYQGKMSKLALSFMKGLLELNPKDRLKGDQVLSHPYFEGLNQISEPKLQSHADSCKGSSDKAEPIKELKMNSSTEILNAHQGEDKVTQKGNNKQQYQESISKDQNHELIQTSINFKHKDNNNNAPTITNDALTNIQMIDNNYKTFYKKKDDIYNFELDMNNIKNSVAKLEIQSEDSKKKLTETSKNQATAPKAAIQSSSIQKKTSDTGGYFSEQSPSQHNPTFKYPKKNYETKFKPIQEETYKNNSSSKSNYDYSHKSSSPVNKYNNYNNINYKGAQFKYNQNAPVYLPNIKIKKFK